MPFTFKTIKATGPYASFGENQNIIKLNKKEIGSISNGNPFSEGESVSVSFMVMKKDPNENGNPNCLWKWITFKKKFVTIDQAKEWLNQNFEGITKTHTFNFIE